jgi:hypothetical protein
MITGIGDHLRPEWPITITGMRREAARRLVFATPAMEPGFASGAEVPYAAAE